MWVIGQFLLGRLGWKKKKEDLDESIKKLKWNPTFGESIFVIPVAKAPSQKETEDCDNDPVNLPPELPKFISCLTLESGLCVI